MEFAGAIYAVKIGDQHDGRPGEAFAQGAKVCSQMDLLLNDACVALFLLLRHGANPRSLTTWATAGQPTRFDYRRADRPDLHRHRRRGGGWAAGTAPGMTKPLQGGRLVTDREPAPRSLGLVAGGDRHAGNPHPQTTENPNPQSPFSYPCRGFGGPWLSTALLGKPASAAAAVTYVSCGSGPWKIPAIRRYLTCDTDISRK
jgi:hypothetical protein